MALLLAACSASVITSTMAQDSVAALYVIHCLDDETCGMVEDSPRGGSKKRMDAYPEHKVRMRRCPQAAAEGSATQCPGLVLCMHSGIPRGNS